MFAVDGDEIYDPAGLAAFRPRLLAGDYDAYWRVHRQRPELLGIDEAAGRAAGHLAPPSRSITKLYNFDAITRWEGVTEERLHGGRITFKPGFGEASERRLHDEVAWDHAQFRCLHVCFLPRSGTDKATGAALTTRRNLADQYSGGPLRRVALRLLGALGLCRQSRLETRTVRARRSGPPGGQGIFPPQAGARRST